MKTTFSQQTENSTQTEDQRRVQLVEALERTQREVKAGRKLIDNLEEQVKSKEKLIKKHDERNEVQNQIIDSLKSEVSNLRMSLDSQKKALEIKQAEADYLKTELAKTQKKLKSSYKREKALVVVVAILTSLFLLK